MSSSIYILTLCLPLGTVLLVFGMRYASAALQARARLANDQAYQVIARQAAAAQSDTAITLSSIHAALTDAADRLSAIETILKAVE